MTRTYFLPAFLSNKLLEDYAAFSEYISHVEDTLLKKLIREDKIYHVVEVKFREYDTLKKILYFNVEAIPKMIFPKDEIEKPETSGIIINYIGNKVGDAVWDISLKRWDVIREVSIRISSKSSSLMYRLENHTGWVFGSEISDVEQPTTTEGLK